MKVFVYNYRDDEKVFIDKFSKKYDVEIGVSYDYPSLENAELARGYEGIILFKEGKENPFEVK